MKIFTSSIVVIGIISYILIYEIVFFFIEGTSFQPITNLFKLSFPFILLFYDGFNPRLIFKNKYILYYILFYTIFLFWLFVLNIMQGGLDFGLIEAFRQVPRYIFVIGLVQFLSKKKEYRLKIIKIVVMYSLFLTLMHFILLLNPGVPTIRLFGIEFAGPFGLLGNVNSKLFIPSIEFPIYRLAGWFNEPSNASAFLLASYFLAKSIQDKMPKSVLWKYAPIICLFGGLAALSNAGYLAVSFSLIIISILNMKTHRNSQSFINYAFIFLLSLSGIILALFGRHFVADQWIDSEVFSVITGSHGNYIDNPYYDPTAGRLDLMELTFEKIKYHPMGIGFQTTAKNIPAGAPLFWLLLSGIPGLFLILLRESVIVFIAKKKYMDKELIYQYGAIMVVMVQQLVYGQWNNAFYYFMVSNILVKISIKE